MRLVVYRGQLIQVQVGVTLGRRQAGVAKEFLNNSEIGAAVKQMCRKTMA